MGLKPKKQYQMLPNFWDLLPGARGLNIRAFSPCVHSFCSVKSYYAKTTTNTKIGISLPVLTSDAMRFSVGRKI